MNESGKCSEVRVTSIEIDKGRDVSIDELLMQLALAETVVNEMMCCLDNVEKNHGTLDDGLAPPDSWARLGVLQVLGDTRHALKSLGWGYIEAYRTRCCRA